jgi:hypothetical protein
LPLEVPHASVRHHAFEEALEDDVRQAHRRMETQRLPSIPGSNHCRWLQASGRPFHSSEERTARRNSFTLRARRARQLHRSDKDHSAAEGRQCRQTLSLISWLPHQTSLSRLVCRSQASLCRSVPRRATSRGSRSNITQTWPRVGTGVFDHVNPGASVSEALPDPPCELGL